MSAGGLRRPGGYDESLAAVRAPNHEDHASMRTWVGRDFDPEAFDLEAVNEALD